MWEVFFIYSGETVAMFTKEVYARQCVTDLRERGHYADYDVASRQTCQQVLDNIF